MYDLSAITIKPGTDTKIIVENKSNYPLIGKGAHGAVFKVDEDKCVKIYVDKSYCKSESKVYTIAQNSPIVPRLYEVGENYILMEYVNGLSLDEYLKKKGRVSSRIAKQMVFMIREMERLGFTRIDSALRHILLDKYKNLKVIDIIWAYTMEASIPSKMFRELEELGFLKEFILKVREIDSNLYSRWMLESQE